MQKLLKCVLAVIIFLYFIVCLVLYFYQEKVIFFPEKLALDYQFTFRQPFEEITIKTSDNQHLHGLLFKVNTPKGLIFYLHGNAGSLASWGEVAKVYTNLGYDVFLLDYRGYGKSEGKIINQNQLFKDNQFAYNQLKQHYRESDITIIGYSVGSGFAAKLACSNHPKRLILQAPYYSMTDMMARQLPIIPTFLLKYKLTTNEYLKQCNMPVIIFHGNQDEVIYYGSSLKLQQTFKPEDKLIILTGQSHNGMTENRDYQRIVAQILAN